MQLLLHAITPTTDVSRAIGPFGGLEPVRLDAHGLTAWATPIPVGVQGFTRDDLLAHHHQVDAIFAMTESILPARFPTIFENEEQVREAVESRTRALVDQLERVRGYAELAVTALWMAPDDAPPNVTAETPGRRYLLERQARLAVSERRHERARWLASEIEREAGPDLVEARHTFCPSAAVGLSSALLVRRCRIVEIRSRLVRPEQDVRILINGPWPPYTFAGVGSQ